MASALVAMTPAHEALMKEHETAVVRMLMAADMPDHVHPMMLATIRAMGSMALEMIDKDDSQQNVVALIDSLEKDCRHVISVLWKAAGNKFLPAKTEMTDG